MIALLMAVGPAGYIRVTRRVALYSITHPHWCADTALRMAMVDCGYR